MFSYIQSQFDFSDYQIAQLKYLFKSLASEGSKFIIFSILFHSKIRVFLFSIALLCILRIFSGGLHCKTYIGCFLTSLLFFVITLHVLSPISIPNTVQLLCVLLCIIAGYLVAPLPAKCHVQLQPSVISRCRNIYITILFVYLLTIYIIPSNLYLQTGFWVIILQSLQLLVAKIIQKGVHTNEKQTS